MYISKLTTHMFAVVEVNGHQYIVEKGQKIQIDSVDAAEGSELELTQVLLINEDGKDKVQLGMPVLEGAKVVAKILEHTRGDKIRVFKMKPKKRSRRTHGHRSDYTILEIIDILK